MRPPAIVAWSLAAALCVAPRPAVLARQATATATVTASAVSEFDVNGLKVLVKRRPGSLSVTAGLFLRGGSRNITAANAGIEALMLDVASEASTNYSRERVRTELSRTGTAMASAVNHDYAAFWAICTRQHFDRAWDLFTDAALRPSFAADDVDRVRNRAVIALTGQDDEPDQALQTQVARVIYAGHPYANDPNGSAASIRALTGADLKRYHQQIMQTSRLLLVVVGDVDPPDIRRKAEAAFGALPRGGEASAPVPAVSFAAPTLAVTARALETNYVRGVYAAPSPASPDMDAMRVATSILRDRIFAEVRVKRNLSYAPDATLDANRANTGSIYVTAVDANQAVRVMLGEITKLRTVEVTRDDIQAIAQQFLTSYYMGQGTNAAQAGALARAEIVDGGWRTAEGFLDRVRAVTPADVRRVAETYLRNIQFVVLGNPQQIDRSVFLPGGR